MTTIIVWFRNDLRVYDHPALHAAVQAADRVLPVFIADQALLKGRHGSPNRTRFLAQSLSGLHASLKGRGAGLLVEVGKPEHVLERLARQHEATAVYYSADFTPYALRRDKRVKQHLEAHQIEFHSFGGRLLVDRLADIKTRTGEPFKVFTPFWKNWQQQPQRDLLPAPDNIISPNLSFGDLKSIEQAVGDQDLSPSALKGGEEQALKRLKAFLDGPVGRYHENHNDLAADATSRLSAYLHLGCISPRTVVDKLPDSRGANAFHRQLAWRDFYHYVLFHFPNNAAQEFQERYRSFAWEKDETLLRTWQEGRTGYPVVDAAIRQLRQEGWMHNRARLIVGSFLTKDLGLDWRLGEQFFMRWLIDGGEANNNGNWQWIASVGVDPAPVFRRLYNPASQQKTYDPTGAYVYRYVPELKHVPPEYLGEPWKMDETTQKNAKCIIGKDYPTPIVDHAEARKAAIERYRQSG